MPSKSDYHRVFFAFVLLAAFVLASLPAEGRQVRSSATDRYSVAVTGYGTLSGIWRFVVNLWPRGTTKEGTSIDPDGNINHTGISTSPAGDVTDEGVLIDPNGTK